MAKIALISEFADSATWSLAEGLHYQKQDVLLITSRNQNIDRVPTFEIMTPFHRWSTLEAFKLFPRLIQWNPDVIHFVFSQGTSKVHLAHWLLAPALSAIPGKALAISSFSELNLKGRSEVHFLKFFNLMTFGTRTHLMRIKRSMPKPPLSEVIPPFEISNIANQDRVRPEIETLVEKLGRYIVMPHRPATLEALTLLKHAGFETLVFSESFKFNAPYYSTGALSPIEKSYVMKSAQAIWLAGMDLSVNELRTFQDMSQSLEKPLLVSPEQNEILPGLCWHLKSGWILDQGLASLEQVLRSNPNLEMSGRFQGVSHSEILDSTLNELLRLYSRILQQRPT